MVCSWGRFSIKIMSLQCQKTDVLISLADIVVLNLMTGDWIDIAHETSCPADSSHRINLVAKVISLAALHRANMK